MDVLLEHDADILLHLGDVGTVEVIDALVTARAGQTEPIEAHLVFGNTDWDIQQLGRYARSLGVHVDHPMGRLDYPDGWLAFTHGHDPGLMRAAVDGGARYLCHGHTHRQSDLRQGATRIVNPGALFRASTYSVAVIDTDSDEVRFYPVGDRR